VLVSRDRTEAWALALACRDTSKLIAVIFVVNLPLLSPTALAPIFGSCPPVGVG